MKDSEKVALLVDALEWMVALLPDPELDKDEIQRDLVIKAKGALEKVKS